VAVSEDDLTVPLAPPSSLPVARQLTYGDFDHSGLALTRDGTRLFTVSARHAGRDEDLRSSEVLEVTLELDDTAVAGNSPVRVVVRSTENLSVAALAAADDGALWLLAVDVGASGRDLLGRVSALYRSDAPLSESALIRLTDPDQTDQHHFDLDATGGVTPLPDASVLVLRGSRGRVGLVRVRPDGHVESVGCGTAVVTAVVAHSGAAVVAVQTAGSSGDLVLLRLVPSA
jgi:hypothetical protein